MNLPAHSDVMRKKQPAVGAGGQTNVGQAETRAEQAETRAEQAEMRAEQAETRTEQAKTRTESAETRTEQAESRTDLAKARTEQAESRTQQAESALQNLVHHMADQHSEISAQPMKNISPTETADWKIPLQRLTTRQREILQLIAEGQTTKQIGDILKVSPKTVEYHRMKLMYCLNLHDVPGLVRFALGSGLIPPGS
jgi:DNA-binding CsgD family transcriptional regulator